MLSISRGEGATHGGIWGKNALGRQNRWTRPQGNREVVLFENKRECYCELDMETRKRIGEKKYERNKDPDGAEYVSLRT